MDQIRSYDVYESAEKLDDLSKRSKMHIKKMRFIYHKWPERRI